MSRVFISYRRNDSGAYARAIYNRLSHHLSVTDVFMDVDTIQPGVDFVRVLEDELRECELLLAVIGKEWAYIGNNRISRLDDPNDFVRVEISTALARGIPVIPLLVDGVTMPRNDTLPTPLQPLTRRNALEISHTRFDYDVDRVVSAVLKILGEEKPNRAAEGVIAGTPRKSRYVIQERQRLPKLSTSLLVICLFIILFSGTLWFFINNRREYAKPSNEQFAARPENHLERTKQVKDDFAPVKSDSEPVLRKGTVFRDPLRSGGEGPELVVIPAGTFMMGGGDDKPVHRVRIRQPFAISRFEITFEDYDRFARNTGRVLPGDNYWGRERRPVITVTWEDAVAYTNWLVKETGKHYRLPSEAEWEYAARAGTQTKYWWGDTLQKGIANCMECGSKWDNKQTAPVGSFPANHFGIYDSSGNVAEMVQDCWHDDYNGAPEDGSAWGQEGGGDCNTHITRGGSWLMPSDLVTSAHRFFGSGAVAVGFRVVREMK